MTVCDLQGVSLYSIARNTLPFNGVLDVGAHSDFVSTWVKFFLSFSLNKNYILFIFCVCVLLCCDRQPLPVTSANHCRHRPLIVIVCVCVSTICAPTLSANICVSPVVPSSIWKPPPTPTSYISVGMPASCRKLIEYI